MDQVKERMGRMKAGAGEPSAGNKIHYVEWDFSDPTIKRGFNAVAFLHAHILAWERPVAIPEMLNSF